jgi:hypothetical protein
MTLPLEVTDADADDDADVDVSNKVEQTKVDESPKVDEKSSSVENDESAVRYIQVTQSLQCPILSRVSTGDVLRRKCRRQ